MRRSLVVVLAAVLAGGPALAVPNPAMTAFTRAANAPAGRALTEIALAVTPGTEAWRVTGQDVTPFYYEQGVAYTHAGELVFSSRGSLTRTSLGCPDALDPDGPCYDSLEENFRAIPGAERQEGFDHIGDIDIAGTGPAEGYVFAALEQPSYFGRTKRGYMAYDVATLTPSGKLIETVTHGFHSWVTVDPTGEWLIAADRGLNPIRAHRIARAADGSILIERDDSRDVAVPTPDLPNMAGCAFDGPTTLYCSNWISAGTNLDVVTEVYRIDLSDAVGTPGATGEAVLALTLKGTPRYGVTGNVPYGLETEGITFYGGEMHVQLRGETLGYVHLVHLAPPA